MNVRPGVSDALISTVKSHRNVGFVKENEKRGSIDDRVLSKCTGNRSRDDVDNATFFSFDKSFFVFCFKN